MLKPNHRKLSGFSIAEFVIVLGVAGTIIGGLWVLSSDFVANSAQVRFSDQLTNVVRGMRGVLIGTSVGGQTGVPISMGPADKLTAYAYYGSTTSTAKPNAFKIFQPELVESNTIKTPWKDTGSNPITPTVATFKHQLYVCGWAVSGGAGQCTNMTTLVPDSGIFAVEVVIPSKDACFKAVLRNSGTQILGLIDVSINGMTIVKASGLALPPTFANIASLCVAGTNTVDFIYKINP